MRSPRRRARPPTAVALAAVVVVLAWSAASSAGVDIFGARGLRAIRGANLVLGPVAPSTPIEFTLVLRNPHPAQLWSGLETRVSPMSPSAFGRRFGPSDDELAALRTGLAADGLRVTAEYPQRTAIRATGPAEAVDRLFGVRLVEHLGPAGPYHAPDGAPSIPAWMRGAVTAVTGLSDQPILHPFHHLGEVPKALTPDVVSRAYDVTPLRDAGIDGSGETVAIVSFATVDDGDVASFDDKYGISGPPVEHVDVDGGTNRSDLEAALDVEVVRGLAPSATILNFEAPNGRVSIGDVVDAVVADGRADMISVSWGFCDTGSNDAEQQRDERSFEAAAAAGITIFTASGDAGAYDCQRQDPGVTDPTVDWPSASPAVVSVGGTRLFLTKDGAYERETGWEDVLSHGGSGGGVAPGVSQPSWQSGPGVDRPQSNGSRQIPDVAGPADPDSGFAVVATGPDGFGTYQIGGTSAAAPFWAATAALLQQDAKAKGAPAAGFLGPLLYQLASKGSASAGSNAFHDVTLGRNRLFVCGPGWDFVTGLGSPDVVRLAEALIPVLKAGGLG